MDRQYRSRRLAALFGAVLLATLVGFAAYQIGVSHGVAVSGQLAAAPNGPMPYGPYGWYRPHFFGFGFVPFVFLFFWFVLLRGFFWGGPRRWRSYPRHWEDESAAFEAWHRRAHERMTGSAAPKQQG
jgi:hypothetical protein